jgi:uncharacterized protein (UPF0335 family)
VSTTTDGGMAARDVRVPKVKQVAEEIKKGSNSAGKQLKSIVDRIEKLEAEKAAVSTDISDVYAEAKSAGFDPKVLRQVVRNRKTDPAKREEFESLVDTYEHAIGM